MKIQDITYRQAGYSDPNAIQNTLKATFTEYKIKNDGAKLAQGHDIGLVMDLWQDSHFSIRYR